ncbi:MAG: hypothetical protein KGS60_18675 [Verrucomicrobia bacterium]|nr:hypothetical protein [Verrucomicrobiota bacterium]
MVLPHPFLKRLLSRVVFYGGAACYLWVLQFVEQQMAQNQSFTQPIPSVIGTIAP